MAKPAKKAVVPSLPDWFLPVVSLGCLILFVLHLSKTVELDSIAMLLLAACAVVWMIPLVSKLKLGDLELELKVDAIAEAMSEPKQSAVRPPKRAYRMDHSSRGFAIDMGDGTMLPLDLDAVVHQVSTGSTPRRKGGRAVADDNPPLPAMDLPEAMRHPLYAFRTEDGLARDTDLSPTELRQQLEVWQAKGFAMQLTGADGRKLWGLTAEGKARL